MRAPEYERLSDGAHLAVVLAERDARLGGHQAVSVEHLVVALASSDTDAAGRLASLDISVDELLDRVVSLADPAPAGAVERTVFSPALRRAVQLAGRVAAQERSASIEGRHLLAAALEVLGRAPRPEAERVDEVPKPRRSLFAVLTGR